MIRRSQNTLTNFVGACRSKASTVIVGALILSAAIWMFTPTLEPSFQGRPLGFWLRALNQDSNRDAALQAIDAIGVKSIPFLLKRLSASDSRMKLRILNLGVSLEAIDRWDAVDLCSSARHSEAIAAFTYLGARAKAAIPKLLTLTESRDPRVRTSAWAALAQVVGDDITRYLRTKPQPVSEDVRVESLPTAN